MVSVSHKIWFYNMNSGELLGFWMVPDELWTKSVQDAFYDDTAARVQISVLVETLHPYSD